MTATSLPFPAAHKDALAFVRAYVRLNYHSLVIDTGDTVKLMDTLPAIVREAALDSPTFIDAVLIPELEAEKRKRVRQRKQESVTELEHWGGAYDREEESVQSSSVSLATKRRKLSNVHRRYGGRTEQLKSEIARCEALLAKEKIVIKDAANK